MVLPMRKIPVIKLTKNGSPYYPLSVGESTVTTHDIKVGSKIGYYHKGEIIPAVTTFDDILTNILTCEDSYGVEIDGKTIVNNDDNQITVNKDNETIILNKDGKLAVDINNVVKVDGRYIIRNSDGSITIDLNNLIAVDNDTIVKRSDGKIKVNDLLFLTDGSTIKRNSDGAISADINSIVKQDNKTIKRDLDDKLVVDLDEVVKVDGDYVIKTSDGIITVEPGKIVTVDNNTIIRNDAGQLKVNGEIYTIDNKTIVKNSEGKISVNEKILDIAIDNTTIVKNNKGELSVDKDEVLKDIKFDNKTIIRDDESKLAVDVDEVVKVDDKYITKNDNDELTLDLDEVVKVDGDYITKNDDLLDITDKVVTTDTDQEIEATKTFNEVRFKASNVPEVTRQVEDPDPDGSFVIPEGLPELPEDNITSGDYVLSKNRDHAILIRDGVNASIYIKEGVQVLSPNDGVVVETLGELHLYNKGIITSADDVKSSCAIFNEGKCYVKGGKYEVGKNGKCYYNILNHGEIIELWDVNVSVNSGVSSLLVNGYYNTVIGHGRQYIAEGKGSLAPKCIIHSGKYDNNSSTGTIKNDGYGDLIIYDGTFSGKGGQCLQHSGNSCEIHGGSWSKYFTSPTRLIYIGADVGEAEEGRKCKTWISGGLFTCSGQYWLWLDFNDSNLVKPDITGGTFGPTTVYVKGTLNGAPMYKNLPIDEIISEKCAVIKTTNKKVDIIPLSDFISSLNGIQFEDGNIKSTGEGLIINGIKDILDPTSAVSKAYVDKAVSQSGIYDDIEAFKTMKQQTSYQVQVNTQSIEAGSIDPVTKLEYTVEVPAGRVEVLYLRTCYDKIDQNIIIDWGDGNVMRLKEAPDVTKDKIGLKEGLYINMSTADYEYDMFITHIYKNENARYTVNIYGNSYWSFQHHNDYPNLMCRVLDLDLPVNECVVNFTTMAVNANRLLKVSLPAYYSGIKNIQNCTNMFRNCKNLKSAIGFSKYLFLNVVRSAGAMFNGCSAMETCDAHLAYITGNYTNNNNNMFNGCSNLTADLVKLLPDGGFTKRVISMNSTFINCSKISCSDWEYVESILWGDETKIWKNTTKCFLGCSDELRENIPESWGGLKKLPFSGEIITIKDMDEVYETIQRALIGCKINQSLETDDDLYQAIEKLATVCKLIVILKTDDDLPDAIEKICYGLGAKQVVMLV